jgi:hypothetical protein
MMSTEDISSFILASDLLMPLTMLSVWLVFRRAGAGRAALIIFGTALVAALVWGSLWAYLPSMANLRSLPPPRGQAGAILAVAAGFSALMLFQPVRSFFRTGRIEWLVTLGVWRFVYGSVLLLMGLLDGLPPAFFWSAALGDIAVGLWALTIMARQLDVRPSEITAWNVVGLMDLARVLVLGAINLRAFYLANPDIAPLNLLPLVGVPVFLALHGMTLWGIAARRKADLSGGTTLHAAP